MDKKKKSLPEVLGDVLANILITCLVVCLCLVAVALTCKFLIWLI